LAGYAQRLDPGDNVRLVPFSALMRVLFALGLLLLFALGHLHLRFMLDGVRRDAIRLQTTHDQLTSENNALRGELEALKQPERLFEFARAELGMMPYGEERVEIRMPEEIYTRYAMARTKAGGPAQPPLSPTAIQAALWLERLGERVGWAPAAQAGE